MNRELKLEKALNASSDELYALIGFSENQELYGATPNIKELISKGKKWMDTNRNKLQELVCRSVVLKNTLKDKPVIEIALMLKK